MNEKERNKRLFLLLSKLYQEQDLDAIELIETMINNDTASIKKTFDIMKNSSYLYNPKQTEN